MEKPDIQYMLDRIGEADAHEKLDALLLWNEDLAPYSKMCRIYLQQYGPSLPRPYADTVKSSQYPNMKELRVQHAGHPVRAFYAFDPERRAIVLCAGDKSGEKQFL
jgi:hypothetical protein